MHKFLREQIPCPCAKCHGRLRHPRTVRLHRQLPPDSCTPAAASPEGSLPALSSTVNLPKITGKRDRLDSWPAQPPAVMHSLPSSMEPPPAMDVPPGIGPLAKRTEQSRVDQPFTRLGRPRLALPLRQPVLGSARITLGQLCTTFGQWQYAKGHSNETLAEIFRILRQFDPTVPEFPQLQSTTLFAHKNLHKEFCVCTGGCGVYVNCATCPSCGAATEVRCHWYLFR